ncbi:radical SAM family heme chaperone HemW [Ghiorsea bivora]|uniref:radical SAM family heme chaperone HemW n=1 Tax=Ghiorsea bivora TaxID=1485545 RepID=UPI001E444961|nr:radical SAM family heme chaperone HemW [Ghiorsea bivora]
MRLYVHTPFCLHKCHYCDFNSHVFAEPPWQTYTQALVAELKHYAEQPQFQGCEIQSVFFGGGTPSLAPASLFAAVLDTLAASFTLADDIEITLEANPGASEAGRFKAYRAAGINRLSIGVQSFDNDELKWLERIHSADEAEKAYNMARDAGFKHINLDLMYALPDQSLDEWFVSLEKGIALNPEHLSCYQLTVEPHTALHVTHKKQKLALPDEDSALQFFWQTRERLAEAGYAAYEISNFAKQGKHCRHNCGYWLYDDYIGIGAGAAGKWDTQDGGVMRYSNIRAPQSYIDAVLDDAKAVNSQEELSHQAAMGEAVWLGLRQSQGIDLTWFKHRFGQDLLDVYPLLIKQWVNQGKLEVDGVQLKLTSEGLSLADDISASFLL